MPPQPAAALLLGDIASPKFPTLFAFPGRAVVPVNPDALVLRFGNPHHERVHPAPVPGLECPRRYREIRRIGFANYVGVAAVGIHGDPEANVKAATPQIS